MVRYLGKRAITYVVMVFLATSIAFFLAAGSMNPGIQLEGVTPRPSPEQVQRRLASYGLDPNRSVWLRYLDWVQGVLFRWDWGFSPTGERVQQAFETRVWVSVRLVILGILLTVVIGVFLGIVSASKQYSLRDRLPTAFSYLMFCIPVPVVYMATQLAAIAVNNATGKQIFFVSDMYSPDVKGGAWEHFVDAAQHYIVPTVGLVLIGVGFYQVAMRQYLLDNVGADFVRTARATGMTRAAAIRKHATPVSFIPVAQTIAFQIPAVFAGTFFAETIFNWHGLGKWSLEAIAGHDVSASVLMVAYGACIFAVGAILADFAVALIDPRVRFS